MNCPDCGHDTLDYDMCGDYCRNPNCEFDNRSSPETPEGGWPRGSDMDRI